MKCKVLIKIDICVYVSVCIGACVNSILYISCISLKEHGLCICFHTYHIIFG